MQILVFAWFTQRGDLANAGIFALAWSITHITFSFFGMQARGLIATDLRSEFSYPTYRKFIALANLCALGTALCISTLTEQSMDLMLCTIALGFARSFENMSDLLYGFFQRSGKIHYAGQALLGKNLILALLLFSVWEWDLASTAISTLYLLSRIIGFLIEKANTFFGERERSAPEQNLAELFRIAWPLGLSVGILALSLAIPRFFLKHWTGLEAVGCYSTIAALIGAAGTLTNSLGQFYSTVMCRCFVAGMATPFLKICFRLVILVLAIGSCFATSEPLWEESLQFILGENLGNSHFIRTMIWAGTFQCCVFILGFAFSAMREFKTLATLHSVFLAITAVAQAYFIYHFGLQGAAYGLAAVYFAQLLTMSYWIWLGHAKFETSRNVTFESATIS